MRQSTGIRAAGHSLRHASARDRGHMSQQLPVQASRADTAPRRSAVDRPRRRLPAHRCPSLIEASAAWAVLGRENSGYRLGDLIARHRAVLGGSWTRAKDAAFAGMLLRYASEGSQQAGKFIHDCLELGIRQALRRPALADEIAEVTAMAKAFSAGTLKNADVNQLADRARKTERIEVTTMASSKGLEFDTVIILGADEGQVPFFSSLKNPEQMAEDRRKMYVSITRARSRVEITWSGFVQWESGKQSQAGPSRFLSDMRLL